MTAVSATTSAATTWQIDPAHSHIEFSVKHLMIAKVKGRVGAVSGTIHRGPQLATSWVEATIDAASIDTREPQRDQHLRSADFLDVENFPVLTFRSRRILPGSGEAFRIVGDLTIRGVTREVTLEATDEGRA